MHERSSTAKALKSHFSTEDVIQGKPVSSNAAVEVQQAHVFPSVPEVASSSWDSPGSLPVGEGPMGASQEKRSPPFMLELFCGTAGVCARFRLLGGRALGIDHHLKRGKLKHAAVKLDLTETWVQELIEREIRSGRVAAVHIGPPCGTASKARNIPVRKKLRRAGPPNPKPLRSAKFPEGFPWLKGISKAKVCSANALYEFSSRIALICDECQIPFSIENPENSLMWETKFMKPLKDRFFFNVVDACEYGSSHKKGTAFLCNFFASRLQKRCSGNHTHSAWNIRRSDNGNWQFDTAAEAEYPTALARELAASFMDQLLPTGLFDVDDDICNHAEKIGATNQPRRARGPLILSEFKSKVSITCNCDVEPPAIIPYDATVPWQGVPVGSKLLDSQPIVSENGELSRLSCTYGVYFSPEEFVEKAVALKHPFDIPLPLESANMEAIAFILEKGPSDVFKFRNAMLEHYIKRARELQEDERKLHENMPEEIQPIMASKRLLLFREMLKDAGVQDERLFQDMCMGFKLVGDLDPSGQFQHSFKPAALDVEQLRQTAKWAQKAVVGACKRVAEDPEIAAAVWNETLEQSMPGKEWVKGPFTAEEVTERQGPHWVPSRRFGVRQSGKIRSVDDFSQYLINSTVTAHEKIDLEGIDCICSTARFFLGATTSGDVNSWQIPGSEATSNGQVSPGWSATDAQDLFGRCLDLKHAYKQLVRRPCDSWASILAVLNPEDSKVYFFEAVALPFGSVSSVLAFNRAARALRVILARLFRLVVTNFFDDFCQLELGLLQSSAWKTAEMVMQLLGWSISTGDDKRRPFAKSFEILGAVIKLPHPCGGPIEVTNKESRLEQLRLQVADLESHFGKTVSRNAIESIKGRLLYAAGHTFGRCTQLACQLLHRLGGSGSSIAVTAELVHATSEALDMLINAKPRRIDRWNNDPPVLIFTDGAVEESGGLVTHGALLIDVAKQQTLVFGDKVPNDFVEVWMKGGKRQVISQTEIFPVLVAKETWSETISFRSVLWFLDNESAKMALIRSFSPVLDNLVLLQANAKMDVWTQSKNWYSRVPSKSNPSDAASRLLLNEYPNAIQCEPLYGRVRETFRSFELLMEKLKVGS